MLAVIGVYTFHGFLRSFQFRQLCFQLGDSLRIVRADTAHACAADFIKNPLHILPVLHIAVAGCVLLFLFTDREIAAASDKDRRYAGFNGIAVVHILRKASGVGVKELVDSLMVHGIDAAFLLLRKLGGLVYHLPVCSGCAARCIVPEAVCVVGASGCALVDRIILDGCGFRLRRGGFFGYGCFRLLRRVDGLLPRLIAVGGVFLNRHARCGGFLRDFFPHMVFVGFHFCGFL